LDSRRAESFSDGVFAVAITILVFNLLPVGAGTVSSGQLTNALSTAWPQYAAYAVSFLTIGIMWLNHHTLLAHVNRVDRPLLALNLFRLLRRLLVASEEPRSGQPHLPTATRIESALARQTR
jgi:uncharacterized membrane protein